jgi:hypothetical protein
MTLNKTRRKLTWNKVGGLTLAVLVLSALAGVWLMRERIFLAPPLAGSTAGFYLAFPVLLALITFIAISVRVRPGGSCIMLIALPVFAGVIFVVYLALIGPGIYSDVQCQAAPGAPRRLDCRCLSEGTSGSSLDKCVADDLAPLPLIRLVEERFGPR